jgi:hypothetical protein
MWPKRGEYKIIMKYYIKNNFCWQNRKNKKNKKSFKSEIKRREDMWIKITGTKKYMIEESRN